MRGFPGEKLEGELLRSSPEARRYMDLCTLGRKEVEQLT